MRFGLSVRTPGGGEADRKAGIGGAPGQTLAPGRPADRMQGTAAPRLADRPTAPAQQGPATTQPGPNPAICRPGVAPDTHPARNGPQTQGNRPRPEPVDETPQTIRHNG